jgi:hypothetical protein
MVVLRRSVPVSRVVLVAALRVRAWVVKVVTLMAWAVSGAMGARAIFRVASCGRVSAAMVERPVGLAPAVMVAMRPAVGPEAMVVSAVWLPVVSVRWPTVAA